MRKLVLVTIISISAISVLSAQMTGETEEYYRLRQLKQAAPPRYVKMVKLDNIVAGKSVIAEGILFTYKSRKAKEVHIAGNFSQWRPSPMSRGKNGVWFFLLESYEGKNPVRYKFCIDGTWTYDPQNPDRTGDKTGSYLSFVELSPKMEGKQVTYKALNEGKIVFRIYRPDATSVTLVGDFNHWNPELDLLQKGEDGIWRLTKKLYSGTYRYRYLIDGAPSPDIYNPSSSQDDAGDLCSLIQVKQ